MRAWWLGAALAAAIPAAAPATVTILSSVSYDFAPPVGADKTITFDAGGAGYTSSGPGGVVSGTQYLQYTAPALNPTTAETTNYFYATPGATMATEATIGGFGTYTTLSLYWGSIDGFNTLDLFRGSTLVGSVYGSQISALASGDHFDADSNRRVTLLTDIGFDRIGLRTKSNSFEVDNISLSGAVPEPTAWLTMLVGFALVGAGTRAARRRGAALA